MGGNTQKLERVQELCERRFRRAWRAAVAVAVLCVAASLLRPDRWMRPALIVSSVAAAVFCGVMWCYAPSWKLRRAAQAAPIPDEEAFAVYRRCASRDVTLTSIAAPLLALAAAAAGFVNRGLNVYTVVAAFVALGLAGLAIRGARRYGRRVSETQATS